MAFSGSEALQSDNLVSGSAIENNVAFVASCFYRIPFQDYNQDGLHQFSFSEGGVSVKNNIMIAGDKLHQIRFKDPGPGRVTPSADKPVLFKNNYYGFSRGDIAYVWQGDGITPYLVDSVVYGPVSNPSSNDAYNNPPQFSTYFRLCNNNTPITFSNLISPAGRPLYEEYCGSAMVDSSNNNIIDAPVLEFVNSGFEDCQDYRKITYWSAEYGTADKLNTAITYEIGDIVFLPDSEGYTRFYRCILNHSGNFDPNDSPSQWEKIEWDGNRLPPLDLRLSKGSYYDQRGMGSGYNESAYDNENLPVVHVEEGGFKIGSSSTIAGIYKSSILKNVSAIPGNGATIETFNMLGVRPGDVVTVSPNNNLNSNTFIAQSWVSNDDEVSVRFNNLGSAVIDPDGSEGMTYHILAIQ